MTGISFKALAFETGGQGRVKGSWGKKHGCNHELQKPRCGLLFPGEARRCQGEEGNQGTSSTKNQDFQVRNAHGC